MNDNRQISIFCHEIMFMRNSENAGYRATHTI